MPEQRPGDEPQHRGDPEPGQPMEAGSRQPPQEPGPQPTQQGPGHAPGPQPTQQGPGHAQGPQQLHPSQPPQQGPGHAPGPQPMQPEQESHHALPQPRPTQGQGRAPESQPEQEPSAALPQPRPAQVPHVQSAPQAPGAPQLDPEQLRQFQQFQQFQDYLRFTEAQQRGQVVPGGSGPPAPPPGGQLQPAPTPPSPGPKIRMPRFVKRILASVLSALIFLAVLGVAGKLLYDHFFPPQDDDRPASETGGGTYHANKILSTQPYEAVRKVYQQIAQGRPDLACGYFDIPVQQTFATDLGYPDCREAVLDLKKQVTNVNDYAESLPSYVSGQQGTTITIDSCSFGVSGGPALGIFTVQQVDRGQWLITGHAPGPRTCPPPSTAPTPTS